MSEEDWGVYQRGMRAVAGLRAEDVARITPVPEGARDMLDIGGSHGYFSVALCRRYPNLRAVVLDLPQAVKHAAPILAKEGMGERVTHRAGNALTEDLGVEAWDLILVANVIQNFDEAANRELFKRAGRALRPGGVLVIQESFQRSTPENAGLDTILLDFLFSMTSAAKTWSEEEITTWQREAGLEPRETVYFPGSSDYGQQSAVKPRKKS
jgi:predicted O-methyltransferase YrrM